MLKASLRIFRPHPNHRSPRNSPVSLFKENQMTNKLLLFVDCCWQKQKEYFLANVQRVSSFSAFCHHRQEENRTALEWMTLSSHRRFFFCSPTIQFPQNGSNDTQLPSFRCRHFSLSQLFMNLFHLPRCTSSVAPFCVEVHWLLALRLVLSTLSFGPSSLNFLISVWWQVCLFFFPFLVRWIPPILHLAEKQWSCLSLPTTDPPQLKKKRKRIIYFFEEIPSK